MMGSFKLLLLAEGGGGAFLAGLIEVTLTGGEGAGLAGPFVM